MTWKDVLEPGTQTDHVLRVPVAAADTAGFARTLAFDAYGILFGLRGLVRDLDDQLEHPGLLELTRKRLERFRAANEEHTKILGKLLAPLGAQSISFTEYNQYLRDRRAGHLLVKGWDHLFKDWTWGDDETKALLDLASKTLEGGPSRFERVLTLGAGACRFPYEIHRRFQPTLSVAVDSNPLLLSCARRVIQGEALELFEFPTLPRDLECFAVKSTLRCPEPLAEGFEVLAHDLNEWALAGEQFDLVVTPWFIDAVPISTPRLFALVNRVLRKNGTWLNVGPVGFNKRMMARYYSREEVLCLVEAAGFEVLRSEYAPLPYFHNPSSAHWRIEHVLAFAARKEADAQVEAAPEPPAVPEWLRDPTLPVRGSFPSAELKKSFSFCLDLVGRASQGQSVRQLAKAMAAKHRMPEAQLEQVIGATLQQWQDGSRFNPMR